MGLSVNFLEPRRSSSTGVSAAPLHDGRFEAGNDQYGSEGLIRPLPQDVSSDSESDPELDSDEEALYNLGDDLWVHEKYLAYLEKPKDIDILLYQEGQPGDIDNEWMAIAPEWRQALGFGLTKEDASADLQIKLVSTKLSLIEDKMVGAIKIPVKPCKKDALKARNSRRQAKYYDKLEKDSTHWEWSSIRAWGIRGDGRRMGWDRTDGQSQCCSCADGNGIWRACTVT